MDLVVSQLSFGYTGFIRPHQKCTKHSCWQQTNLKTQSHGSLPFMVLITEYLDYDSEERNTDA
jgi:hypothetical protein